MTNSSQKGLIFILLSTVLFGSYGVWSHLIGSSFGPLFQGWARSLIIALVLLPILIYKRELIVIQKKDWGWLTAYLVFTSLTQAPIFYAFTHMDIGTASVLFFVSTLITMYLVGFLFLGEKLSKVKIIAFLLACFGLFFTFSISLASFSLLAASMAVLNGMGSGGELAFSKKLSSIYSPLFVVWLSWVILVITNAPISILIGEVQHTPALTAAWFYLACYCLVSIAGFWLAVAGLKYVEASIGGLASLFEPIFTISFGVILFGEVLGAKVIVGAACIFIAAILPHLLDSKTKYPIAKTL